MLAGLLLGFIHLCPTTKKSNADLLRIAFFI